MLLYLTATLNGTHSASVGEQMISELERVEPGPILEFVRNRMYIAPLPPDKVNNIDLLMAVIGPEHPFSAMLERFQVYYRSSGALPVAHGESLFRRPQEETA